LNTTPPLDPASTEANSRQVGGDHYKTSIQHWDYVIANDIPYLEAQIIKYVTRWRKKNGIQDLRKAQHFLDKLIEINEPPSLRQLDETDLRMMGIAPLDETDLARKLAFFKEYEAIDALSAGRVKRVDVLTPKVNPPCETPSNPDWREPMADFKLSPHDDLIFLAGSENSFLYRCKRCFKEFASPRPITSAREDHQAECGTPTRGYVDQ
jgi:hypothetical protein